MPAKHRQELALVQFANDEITTTSLLVAEKFKKSHKFVLEKIRNLKCSAQFIGANFRPIFYQDSYSREQEMYEITEEGFMFIAMRFTGKAAVEWQERFIEAFQNLRRENERLRKQQSNKLWAEIRQDTRVSFRFMSRMLTDVRAENGKMTQAHHYQNESRLVNSVLTGNFAKLDRNNLSDQDLLLLDELQTQNSKLIARNEAYGDRKTRLLDFAQNWKAIRTQRIQELKQNTLAKPDG